MSISVSMVEDNADVRESLIRLLDGSIGCRCVSEHATGENALEEIPRIKPHVILMDINLTGINGIECTRWLKPSLPGTQIIMLTVYQNAEDIFNALLAGATGYMLKQIYPEKLLAAIKSVHEGNSPMDSCIARKTIEFFQQNRAANIQGLSLQEMQVVGLLAKGYLYQEAADAQDMHHLTIKTHIRRIYEKLQEFSRTSLMSHFAPAEARYDGKTLRNL